MVATIDSEKKNIRKEIILNIIKKEKLNYSQIAELLAIKYPEISDIFNKLDIEDDYK